MLVNTNTNINIKMFIVNHITIISHKSNIIIRSYSTATIKSGNGFDESLFESIITSAKKIPGIEVNNFMYIDLHKGLNKDLAKNIHDAIKTLHDNITKQGGLSSLQLQVFFMISKTNSRPTSSHNLSKLSSLHTQLSELEKTCQGLNHLHEKVFMTKAIHTLLKLVSRSVNKYTDQDHYKDPLIVLPQYISVLFKQLNVSYTPNIKCIPVTYNHSIVANAIMVNCDTSFIESHIKAIKSSRTTRKKKASTEVISPSSKVKPQDSVANTIPPNTKP